jgi:DUF4097 and DUF4098 domain-containing protein YvlB
MSILEMHCGRPYIKGPAEPNEYRRPVMKLRSFIFTATLLASGSLIASVTEEETFSYPLSDGGSFSISNVNGSINITGVKGNTTVEIVASKKADNQEELDKIEIEIFASADADEIVVETELGDSDKWYSRGSNSGSVKYEVIVPAGTMLDSVETVNGGVMIRGVSGDVVAESVNGGLELRDLAGDARLSTVNGSVDAEFDRLDGQQSVKAETVNGRITITLPEDADVEINADTLNGGINGRDFELETEKGFVGSDLNGSIGSGSARMNIDTVNGSIKIQNN